MRPSLRLENGTAGARRAGDSAAFAVLSAALLLLGTPLPAAAQVEMHLDAGMGDAGELRGANLSVAPAIGWTGRWWSVTGSGRYASRGAAGDALMGELEAIGLKRLTPLLAIDAGWVGRQRSLSWAPDVSGWGVFVGLKAEGVQRGAKLELLRGQAQRNGGHVPLSRTEGTLWTQLGLIQLEILDDRRHWVRPSLDWALRETAPISEGYLTARPLGSSPAIPISAARCGAPAVPSPAASPSGIASAPRVEGTGGGPRASCGSPPGWAWWCRADETRRT